MTGCTLKPSEQPTVADVRQAMRDNARPKAADARKAAE